MALGLFAAHAAMPKLPGEADSGKGCAQRAFEHLVLLSDLLALHGQDALSLHALTLAEAAGGEGCGGQWRGRLAVQWAVGGFPGKADKVLEGAGEDGGGEGAGGGSLAVLARAAAAAARGEGERARELIEEGGGQQLVEAAKKEGGKQAGEEVNVWAGAVAAEVLLQVGDGVGALASAIGSLHAVMAAARGGGGGEDDAGAVGRAVREGAVAGSQWRLLCSAARGMERVGQIAGVMGRGR